MKELDFFEFPDWYRAECDACKHYDAEIQECQQDGNCIYNKKCCIMED
jgi:hypothetical protein